MKINIKTNKNFTTQYNKVIEKYGEEFELLNGLHDTQMNYGDFIDNFTKDNKNTADNTIDSNANVSSKDIQSLCKEKGKPHDKLIAFNKIFYELQKKYGIQTAREWLSLELGPYLYMHDAPSATYFPYCFAYDLSRLAKEGLFFIDNYNNEPPRHLQTFLDDVIEYISFMSNRSSGACGIPDIIIWMFYFWKKDVENNYFLVSPEYYLKQAYQKLVFRLNQKFYRDQTQTVFSNVSIFDRVYLEELFGGREYPDGTFVIDYIEEIMDAQKLFMEVISETRRTQLFTYPVLTYSLIYKDGKFVDEEFARWASNHNRKWNDSNFFISETAGALSNCCRLISDTTQLDPFINSIGGTALSVGSVKVSTMNLEAIALEHPDNQEEFLERLKYIQDINMKALDVVRHIIQRNIEKGLLPNFVDGGMEMDKMFCTVGFLGLYEVMEIYGYINTDEFGNKSYSDEGVEFATQILDTINEVKDSFECDFSFNVEMIPAENCAGVICNADNILYEQNKYFIYSNQWIPLYEKCTIQEKCRLGNLFDKKCGGGCIAHIDIESRFANEDQAWDMLNYVASQGVIYFAFTTKISVCEDMHAFIGTKTCPKCGKPVNDTFSRVVGFYTPVSAYQKIRKREWSARKWYDVLTKPEVM